MPLLNIINRNDWIHCYLLGVRGTNGAKILSPNHAVLPAALARNDYSVLS